MSDLKNWPGYWVTGWQVQPDVSWRRTLIPVVIGAAIAFAMLASLV